VTSEGSRPQDNAALRASYEARVRGDIPSPTTVGQLVTAWLSHCRSNYPARPGKRSSTFTNARDATRPLLDLYSAHPIAALGPVELQAVRLYMIDSRLARKTINDRIARIRRMYRWAVDRGWIQSNLVEGLNIDGLRRNRSAAVETEPHQAVPIDSIMRTLRDRRLSPVVKDMVRFQLRTGARPAEVCELCGRDIDTSASPWVWKPPHKMSWLERSRVILIGERAQLVLLPHLQDGPCFLSRRNKPYRIDSYRQEIVRAAERQGVERWTPQQVRMRTATEAATDSEIAARDVLGHADVRTTRKHYIDTRHSPEAMRFVRRFG